MRIFPVAIHIMYFFSISSIITAINDHSNNFIRYKTMNASFYFCDRSNIQS